MKFWNTMEVNSIGDSKIYLNGYFFYKNILYRGRSAVSFVGNHLENIYDMIGSFNGSFCFIVDNSRGTLLACDRLRSKPLFYKLDKNMISYSDCVENLRDKTDSFNDDYIAEFSENLLWMSKDKTLFNDIKQVCAGQLVYFDKINMKLTTYDYFQFNYRQNYSIEQLKSEFWSVYDNVGKRLVEVLDGRTAIIPLSGGYDSRMVLEMLIRQQYRKIICFTYGNQKNEECKISREVARQYNCKWLFVEYNREYHRRLWETGVYQSYYRFAGNYSSLPHIQDFVAVYDLKQKKLIPEDGVFIPGHSGDMLAGSHISKEFLDEIMSKNEFSALFVKKYFGGRPGYGYEYANQTFESVADTSEYCDSLRLLEKYEEINIKERQAKYIVNSCRVYEYFGYDWLIPLWDNELIDFWEKVPIIERFQRKLYIECVGGEIKTTHDDSIMRKTVNLLRRFDFLFTIFKVLEKVPDYWRNPLKIYAFFDFYEYIMCNFKSKGTDNTSLLLNKRYLEFVKQELSSI